MAEPLIRPRAPGRGINRSTFDVCSPVAANVVSFARNVVWAFPIVATNSAQKCPMFAARAADDCSSLQLSAMTKPLVHRPTSLPGADPAKDRSVMCDGRLVGRVFEIDGGQQEGLWRWSCMWIASDTSGTAESLEAGLAEIKARWSAEAWDLLPSDPPGRNR